MAERLDASVPASRSGDSSRTASESGSRAEPDEATRARFEQDLRGADRQDDEAVAGAKQRGEESEGHPSCMGACAPMPSWMALPVPAPIPGGAPALPPDRSALSLDSARSRLPHPTALPAIASPVVEAVVLAAITLRTQGEGQGEMPAMLASRGSDEVRAEAVDVKALSVSVAASTPASTSPAARDQAIVDAAKTLSETLRPDDVQPVTRQAGELSLASGGGQLVTALTSSGAAIQTAKTTGPRVLPERVIEEAVAQMMVGVDRTGAKQIRVELRSEWMPGVRMVLQEAGGRVQIDLICSVEASRQRLSAISGREIGDIARRCKRDLLLRVQSEESTDSEDSGGWHEVLGVA